MMTDGEQSRLERKVTFIIPDKLVPLPKMIHDQVRQRFSNGSEEF